MKDNAESVNVISLLAVDFNKLPEFIRCCIFKFISSISESFYSLNFLSFSNQIYNEFMVLLTKDCVHTTLLSVNSFISAVI